MNNGFGLVVRFTIKDGMGSGFDQLIRHTVEQIRANEPDTLVYACHNVTDKPQERIFYELYRDEAAFHTHESQPYIKRFLAEREDYLSSTMVDFLAPLTAKGLPINSKEPA